MSRVILPRDRLGEEVIHKGRAYVCKYKYVKIENGEIEGSDNKTQWHKLSGRQMLGFDSRPKPSIVMQKQKDYDPMEF